MGRDSAGGVEMGRSGDWLVGWLVGNGLGWVGRWFGNGWSGIRILTGRCMDFEC